MMMTTRRLEPLPDEWASILELHQRVRDAATPHVDDAAVVWATAEAGQASITTGYKAQRRVASAGQYGAHILRLRAGDLLDQGASDPWSTALAGAGPAINAWDWDERMQAALDLRRTFKDEPPPLTAAAIATQVVATWLTHAGGPGLPPATARLCTYVLEHTPCEPPTLAAAWYATHGRRLLAALAPTSPAGPGAPANAEAARRALLRLAVRGVHAGRTTTKLQLAALAGVTRPTLDSWLAGADAGMSGAPTQTEA